MRNISIHAPREGSDSVGKVIMKMDNPFQSTLPARGATLFSFIFNAYIIKFQSTLPARGATFGV